MNRQKENQKKLNDFEKNIRKDRNFNRKKKRLSNKVRNSQFSRQLLLHYLLSLVGFVGGFVLFVAAAWKICSLRIWYSHDPMWQILSWVKEYIFPIGIVICFTAWLIITYYFMKKPLKYLDEVINASEQLALLKETPISLPPEMKNVQDELNLVREQALRNALLAKEAEQRKNDLIVYLAHDLKTPLTSVIGYLTLLMEEPQISDTLREKYTGIALNKAERLEELINQFFDITRFNFTTMTLDMEKINLSRMLEQIVSEFEPVFAEKELYWRTQIVSGIEILCDPDKLERVFDNLIRNAVNYSYRESEVFLQLFQKENFVQINIRNQGKTIAKEKLEHIFEQFFRLDSSRSSATGGSGLGLAIAKEIVELHGGNITAESAEESILFTVTLPVSN